MVEHTPERSLEDTQPIDPVDLPLSQEEEMLAQARINRLVAYGLDTEIRERQSRGEEVPSYLFVMRDNAVQDAEARMRERTRLQRETHRSQHPSLGKRTIGWLGRLMRSA